MTELEAVRQDVLSLAVNYPTTAELRLAEFERLVREDERKKFFCQCDEPYMGTQVIGSPLHCERCDREIEPKEPTPTLVCGGRLQARVEALERALEDMKKEAIRLLLAYHLSHETKDLTVPPIRDCPHPLCREAARKLLEHSDD